MTGIDRRLRGGFLALAGTLLLAAPCASPLAAERVAPAVRAADQLRRDGERLKQADEAAKRAEQAARAAAKAADEVAALAARARRAADRAEAAAEAARKARAAAADAVRAPTARSAVDGRPVFSADRPAAKAAVEAAQPAGTPRVLRVGPTHRYTVPSSAAAAARDGDIIEIEGGIYRGDVAVWRANNLVIRGVHGRPHLEAAGRAADDKGIWVVKGNNTTIENIEMSGARVDDHNGSGIRLEGRNLIVRDCYIHHNEMGILTGHNADSDIVIEDSEFAYNTVDYDRYGALGHNIYIGAVRSFTLKGSYVHDAFSGHNVKSRARVTRLLYNRLMDGADGRSSYIVDLPNGGQAYLIGNVIQQGRDAENWSMINFRSKRGYGNDQLHLLHNTLVSDRANGRFVQSRSQLPVILVNNILVGHAKPVDGEALMVSNLIVGGDGSQAGLLNRVAGRARRLFDGGGQAEAARNVIAEDAGFRDRGGFDYHLVRGSPAIDAGADPAIAWQGAARPDLVFVAPHGTAPRPVNGRPDIGAYEFTGRPAGR